MNWPSSQKVQKKKPVVSRALSSQQLMVMAACCHCRCPTWSLRQLAGISTLGHTRFAYIFSHRVVVSLTLGSSEVFVHQASSDLQLQRTQVTTRVFVAEPPSPPAPPLPTSTPPLPPPPPIPTSKSLVPVHFVFVVHREYGLSRSHGGCVVCR